MLHVAPVQIHVGLGPGRPDGGSFFAIQHAKLNSRGVDGLAHFAAEGVDFFDEMTLCSAADGRIAAHGGNAFDALGDQKGTRAKACRSKGGLAAGMASAGNDHVEFFRGKGSHGGGVLSDFIRRIKESLVSL